jgi:hypothetical protein
MCAVTSAPGPASIRVWEIMSRGWTTHGAIATGGVHVAFTPLIWSSGPNAHVDRPGRANASQRSGRTWCYASLGTSACEVGPLNSLANTISATSLSADKYPSALPAVSIRAARQFAYFTFPASGRDGS